MLLLTVLAWRRPTVMGRRLICNWRLLGRRCPTFGYRLVVLMRLKRDRLRMAKLS